MGSRRCDHLFFVKSNSVQKPKCSAKQTSKFVITHTQLSSCCLVNFAQPGQLMLRTKSRAAFKMTTSPSISRQGADQDSYCHACYTRQQAGNKFCVSCGEPQLVNGGVFMHWSMDEARAKQYTNAENGVSSCGPCSVLSALSMIGEIVNRVTFHLVTRSSHLVRRSCSEADHRERDAA